MGRVLRVLQFLQREVGRGDQRLAASVTAVNHAVNPVSYTHLDVYKRQLKSLCNGVEFKWNKNINERMESIMRLLKKYEGNPIITPNMLEGVLYTFNPGAVKYKDCLLYTSRGV